MSLCLNGFFFFVLQYRKILFCILGFTPNYFICVKINQQHISQNLQKCIQLLAKQFRHEYDRELFLDHVVSFEKLHVTLCVCSITDDSDIAKIQQVRSLILKNIFNDLKFTFFILCNNSTCLILVQSSKI